MRSAGLGVACLAVLLAVPAAMADVTVDGNLSEWGVSPSNDPKVLSFGSIFPSTSGFFALGGAKGFVSDFLGGGSGVTMYYHAEDYVRCDGYVGPQYGSQEYDAEFMGVFVDQCKLYIAIASGQRPDNGLSLFGPGDIRIEVTGGDASGGVFGVEVGGGPGSYGLVGATEENAPGTTYTLDRNGYTTVATSHTNGQLAGTVWLTSSDDDWIMDPITDKVCTQLAGGEAAGTADGYFFNYGGGIGDHSFIELCLDLTVLGFSPGTSGSLSVEWRPACGNDELLPDALAVSCPLEPPPSVVPEPASLLVWAALGLVVAGGWTWRRRYGSASRA